MTISTNTETLPHANQVQLCAAMFEADFQMLITKMVSANWEAEIAGQAIVSLVTQWRRNLVGYSETINQIASCLAQTPSTPMEIDDQLIAIRREWNRLSGDTSRFAMELRRSEMALLAQLAEQAKGTQRLKIQRLLARAVEDDRMAGEQHLTEANENQPPQTREGVA